MHRYRLQFDDPRRYLHDERRTTGVRINRPKHLRRQYLWEPQVRSRVSQDLKRRVLVTDGSAIIATGYNLGIIISPILAVAVDQQALGHRRIAVALAAVGMAGLFKARVSI